MEKYEIFVIRCCIFEFIWTISILVSFNNKKMKMLTNLDMEEYLQNVIFKNGG
jgi:hypothetical protein